MKATQLIRQTPGILLGLACTLCEAGEHRKATPQYQFTEITLPAETGCIWPAAFAINNNGTVVGNCNPVLNPSQVYGWVYDHGNVEILPPVPWAGNFDFQLLGMPFGINDAGVIVGIYTDFDGVAHPCRYTSEDGWSDIELPPEVSVGPQPGGFASGINNHGDIVGVAGKDWYGDTARWRGFLLHHGTVTLLDAPSDLGPADTYAYAINDHGVIAGQYHENRTGPSHGFLYRGGQWTQVDFPYSALPPSVPSWATITDTGLGSINNEGQVVGSYWTSDGTRHEFILSHGVFLPLELPANPGQTSSAQGINDHGVIAGYLDDGYRAFYATPVSRN